MKKRSILALLLLVAVLMQYCKKSSSDDTTTTADTVLFQAYVNNVLWTPPTTPVPVLTYNATAKTKTFSFTADSTNDRMVVVNKITSVGPGTGIPVQIYYVDTTAAQKVTMTYYRLAGGVASTVGTTKSGYMNITAIDSVKQLITGNFGFAETKLNYDGTGKLVSITSTSISSGEFNALPYKYVKQ